MPTKPPIIYADACLFIDIIQRTSSKIDVLTKWRADAVAGRILVITSVLTIAEVVYGPDDRASIEDQTKAINDFFENAWIILRNMDRVITGLASDLRRRRISLKAADAVHIATAINDKAHEFHTYDEKLWKLDGLYGTPPLRIVGPDHTAGLALFDTPPPA
jgi:predicted nucleic acid-binding protein